MARDNLFRHELKYLVSLPNAELIKMRLKHIMQCDPHAPEGSYKIRSLYFDDYWNSAYNEKIMGVRNRRKYRIRIYNDSDAVIKLECKRKVDNYIHKTGASLTREETEAILQGRYDFLLKKENPLCREFYYQCVSRVMRPRVIVDYEREPYICEAGDVRVTFDKNVRATSEMGDFFSSELPSSYVLEPGKAIMEVKFTEFMPRIIKEALPCGASENVAASKYVECYFKTNYNFLEVLSGI